MKVDFNNVPAERLLMAFARAASRQIGLSRICAIRKCRRDGFCSGPLVVATDDDLRIAPDNFGVDGVRAVPLCHLCGDDAEREELLRVMAELSRQVAGSVQGTMWETTCQIASRRWRRITFADDAPGAAAP